VSATPPSATDALEVRLTLPAVASFARVARLAITGLASRCGFSYDEVEDLRIAIGEVFGLLVGGPGPEGTVRFACRIDDALRITAERVPESPLAEVGELSTMILGAVVAESTIEAPSGRITITARSGTSP
jgi:hypothetical protein